MIAFADLTATATLILAGITLALAAATVALVVVTRQGTAQAREDARAELKALERQVGSSYRPLLVDVLTTAPVPSDMGWEAIDSKPTTETRFPNLPPTRFDPRTAFVAFEAAQIFLSVPLRNVGRGLAVIDGGGVEIEGPFIDADRALYRTIQRYHVPVNETTRIDLIARYRRQETATRGAVWLLRVPYSDFAGEQRTVARVQIVCRGDDVKGPWLVERVDHLEERVGDAPTAPLDPGLPPAGPAWLEKLPSPIRRHVARLLEARQTP